MCKIILFEHTDFRGKSKVLTTSDPDFNRSDWNDIVSSVIVLKGEWGLYEHTEYRGSRWAVSEKGGPDQDGAYPSYNDWGGKNDVISSAKCR